MHMRDSALPAVSAELCRALATGGAWCRDMCVLFETSYLSVQEPQGEHASMPARRRHKPHKPQSTMEALSTLETALHQLAYCQHIFTIFRHFVELSAIALSNVTDPINKEVREKQYLSIVKQ